MSLKGQHLADIRKSARVVLLSHSHHHILLLISNDVQIPLLAIIFTLHYSVSGASCPLAVSLFGMLMSVLQESLEG